MEITHDIIVETHPVPKKIIWLWLFCGAGGAKAILIRKRELKEERLTVKTQVRGATKEGNEGRGGNGGGEMSISHSDREVSPPS